MRTRQPELDALIVWALATFHASFFLLAFLLFLYWQDVLRNVLPGLSTLVGIGLFVVLWALTWFTTRRALRGLEGEGAFLGRAARWGGVNGVLFLIVIFAGQVITLLGAGEIAEFRAIEGFLQAALFGFTFGLVIGSIVAFAIGAVVGLILALLDLVLLSAARRLVLRAVGAETAPATEAG